MPPCMIILLLELHNCVLFGAVRERDVTPCSYNFNTFLNIQCFMDLYLPSTMVAKVTFVTVLQK
jgi:hypothetical protein